MRFQSSTVFVLLTSTVLLLGSSNYFHIFEKHTGGAFVVECTAYSVVCQAKGRKHLAEFAAH